MSTDYGYKCIDCNESEIIDNMRYYGVESLKGILELPLQPILESGLLHITYEGYGASDAIQFAFKHKSLGHRVVVADEYGAPVDECGKYYRCSGECGHNVRCTQPDEHEGACKPEGV